MSKDLDEIDSLIDGALQSYMAQEPRAGWEGRILHRARAGGVARIAGFHAWGWGVAAAACAVWIVVQASSLSWQSPALPLMVFAAPKPPLLLASVLPEPVLSEPAAIKPRVRKAPKLDAFPAVSPLTSQERAMVAYLTLTSNNPPGFLAQQEPIQIEAIKITPLQSDGGQ